MGGQLGFPGGSDGKRICLQRRRPGFNPWVRKIPWRSEWLPTPLFLPGEFHGQRSLAGYSPWYHKKWESPTSTVFEIIFSHIRQLPRNLSHHSSFSFPTKKHLRMHFPLLSSFIFYLGVFFFFARSPCSPL